MHLNVSFLSKELRKRWFQLTLFSPEIANSYPFYEVQTHFTYNLDLADESPVPERISRLTTKSLQGSVNVMSVVLLHSTSHALLNEQFVLCIQRYYLIR